MDQLRNNKISNNPILYKDENTTSTETVTSLDYLLETSDVIIRQDFLCGQIGLSTTIICKDKIKNRRIDSRISSISLRPSCDMVRRCDKAYESQCEECDKFHADLLLGMELKKDISADSLKEQLENHIRNQISQNMNGFPVQNGIEIAIPEVLSTNMGIPCLKYRCPMLGYIEMMFPICLEGTVIAVLILGQIRLEGKEELRLIKKTKERFLERKEKMFNEYIEEVKKSTAYNALDEDKKGQYSLEAIKQFIMCGDKTPSTSYIDIYKHNQDSLFQGMLIPSLHDTIKKEELKGIIDKTCNWIVEFENNLQEKTNKKRSEELNNLFQEEQLSFIQEINAKHLDDSNINDLWMCVSESIKRFCVECHLHSMIMYSIEGKHKLKIIASADNNDMKQQVIKGVEERLSDLLESTAITYDNITYQSSACEVEYKNILTNIFSSLSDSYVLMFYPRREIPEASIFVLFEKEKDGYADSVMPSLLSGLRNYVTRLSGQIARIYDYSLQNKIDTVFRFYRHETRNLAGDFRRAIKYLRYAIGYLIYNAPDDLPISINKFKKVATDAKSSLDLFWALSENLDDKILDDEPPVFKKTDFNIYDLIYKWESVRRGDLQDKNSEIIFEKLRIPVYSDSRFLEIIIYNLITNAVKYCFSGTKIYVNCKRDEGNSNRIIFSISNFTFEIPADERDKIFQNGYRCATAKRYTPDGSGMGLWLCRKIASYYDGNVILKKHRKVSNYNVPLLKKLIENKDFHAIISPEQLIDCQKAYDDLREWEDEDSGKVIDYLDHIVSNRHFEDPDVVKAKILELLNTPTYLVNFEVDLYV